MDPIDDALDGAPNGWNKVSATITRREEQYPTSLSAHISRSMGLIHRAWKIRGNKAASQVDPNAWKPFHEGIADAGINLEKYKSVSSSDPEWYEEMLLVAIADEWGRGKFDAVFNEGLRKEPLFYETYFSALNYLLPKWHRDIN